MPGRQPAGAAGSRAAGSRAAGPRARVIPGGPEIVAGRSAVLDALRARVPSLALHVGPRLDSDDRIGEAVKLAADSNVPVVETGRAELDRLVPGVVHQGLALRIRPYEYAHPDELLADVQPGSLIVALDGVTDPAELGAVVRAAAAFGGAGVVVPARRSAEVTAAAWKASAGAVARIPVAQAPNLPRTLASCAQAGMFVVGVAPAGAPGAADIVTLDLADQPLVLVTGPALSRLVAQQCDAIVTLGTGDGESLTAPVAAGIAMYQLARLHA